ncbi:ABC transporter substrate-binding protein [Staphylococcus auricularis]|uniref:ABC transporter substrate-binding protein n=1 Tax=Staphylococcus auricularis TaxID=29379 RepID=UPI001EF39AA6|nr:ABC transporter substrate-binding protein [Staphylococcus auricularis]MCG7340695.1 ABC transporter substrate-binding protein [Staphylococcus auricularis]
MRNRFKKFLILAVVFSFILTGCSSDNNEEKNITLHYWSSYNDTEPQAEVLRDAAEAFSKENDDIDIKMSFNGRENSDILPTAIQGNRDVTMYDANGVNIIDKFSQYNAKLDKYAEKSYPNTNGKPFKEYTSKTTYDLAKDLGEGNLYYVPMNPQAFVFMYNKTIFKDAGVDKVPKTWDEFIEVGEKIKDKGYTVLTTDPEYSTGILGYYLSRLKGEEWVKKLTNDKTMKMWDDPAVLEAAKAIEDLAKRGFYDENISSMQFPEAQQNFVLNNKVAMYLNGTWMPNEVQRTANKDFEWGQFRFPEVKGGKDNIDHLAFSSYGIGINKDTTEEERKAAFEFAVFVNTKSFDKQMADKAKALPVDPKTEYPKDLKDMEPIFKGMEDGYISQTAIKDNADLGPIIQSAVIKLISGKSTAEEFIEEIKNA